MGLLKRSHLKNQSNEPVEIFCHNLLNSRVLIILSVLLFINTETNNLNAETTPALKEGIGTTLCFDVISWQHHKTAKNDITKWIVNFIDEVNKATRSKGLVKKVPLIQLNENLVWYGALAYCSLDTKQTLVEATMKLITNEWEKSEKR
ncbi:MAG: hypothetical protein VX962_08285 [Pseudomonadota bacterium]|nr:hypothetical protein [Pseudomonadota bacterium]